MSKQREIGPELVRRMSLTGELIQENAALRAELEEEARINGMGGEREARLMAIVAEKESEIARLRLTDEEREAVEWCIFQQATPQRIAATLRKLLERLGGND